MARVNLKCKCGWVFSVADTHMGKLVNCPNCSEPIRVPAPKGHKVLEGPPAQIAAEKEKQRRLLMYSIYALVGVAVLIGVIVIASGKKSVPLDDTATNKTRSRPDNTNVFTTPSDSSTDNSRSGGRDSGSSDSGTYKMSDSGGSGKSSDTSRAGSVTDNHRRIDLLVQQCNVAGVVCELLRLGDERKLFDERQDKMRAWEAEIAECLKALDGKGEAHLVPIHLQAGDSVTFFNGKNMAQLSKNDAIGVYKKWLTEFHGGTQATLGVKRNGNIIECYMYFPGFPKELMNLMTVVDIKTTGAPIEEPKEEPRTPQPLPSSIVKDVTARVGSLHPYYLSCIPEDERARMDALLKAGKGLPEDVDFLKARILGELCDSFMSEQALFADKVKQLSAQTVQAVGGDVIYFKDKGRKPIEGKIESEDDDGVKVKGKLGSIRIPKDDIDRIERGKGAGVEFPAKYEAAKDKVDELSKLIAWCEEKQLAVHKEFVAYVILTKDPGHEAARKALKYTKGEGGVWRNEGDLRVENGKIEWDGSVVTPEELKQRLAKQGFVEVNGLWCAKYPKTLTIDNLYRDEKKLMLTGSASVTTLKETSQGSVYDLTKKQWVKTTKNVETARYIGSGMGRSAVAYLMFEAPYDIIDCKVKATSHVIQVGGVVTVSIVTDPNERVDPLPLALYSLSTVGVNESWYTITDKVKGLRRFYIKAEITEPPGVVTGATTAHALFLPSSQIDLKILEIRYTLGQPLDRINKLLKDAPKVKTPGDKASGDPSAPSPTNTEVSRKIDDLAVTALKTSGSSCLLVMDKMRQGTAGMKFTTAPELLPKWSACVKYIENPLTFQSTDLSNAAALDIGAWWKDLRDDDKLAFAKYFGLWCAYTRYSKEK